MIKGVLAVLYTIGLFVGSIRYEWFVWVWVALFIYFLITLPNAR